MRSTDTDRVGARGTPRVAEQWSLGALARRHPRAAGATLGLLAVLVAVTLITTLAGPRRTALSDASSCSQWAAATPAQQTAYAHLYIDEYGRTADTAARAAAMRSAINRACTHAAYLGEASDVSIVASLRRAF
ncbi:MAG TPA: hypothetical protein VKV21_16325 [Solirubrobacteraceae bacterium]|nr:hypothetical protein [Solirubrobacteraceae bacterium]